MRAQLAKFQAYLDNKDLINFTATNTDQAGKVSPSNHGHMHKVTHKSASMGGCVEGNCYGIHAEFQLTPDGKTPPLRFSPYEYDISIKGPSNVKVTVVGPVGVAAKRIPLPAVVENVFIPKGRPYYDVHIHTYGPQGKGTFDLRFHNTWTKPNSPL